jgi:gentisate 1,2-dioxygenase
MAIQATESATGLNPYVDSLRAAGLDAPWTRPGPLIQEKASRVQAKAWRWAEIEPLVRRSPEFMKPGRGAERRIVRLDNPGVPERTSTHTISTAVQYLLPGEVAPAHRHTPNAIRFMLDGEGAFTTVEGARCVMQRGDVVLTPSMTWHDHGNEGRQPVLWIDGLDSPVVRYLENLFGEPYPEEQQPTGGDAARVWYRWKDWHARLLEQARQEPDPYDDVIIEYRDPVTGRSVLDTIGCFLQLLRPGTRTRAHWESSSAVYHVVAGRGTTFIDGVRYAWGPRDFLAVPPRAVHRHANEGTEPAILFSFQDVPLLKAIGHYRMEPVVD